MTKVIFMRNTRLSGNRALLCRALWALALALASCLPAQAQRQNSLRPRLKLETNTDKAKTHTVDLQPIAAPDTLTGPAANALVCLSGYQKVMQARQETMFATNLASTDTLVEELRLCIEYRDSQARQLHRRHLRLRADVPPGQTRKIDFPSWDRQNMFYYKGSPRPRRPSVPYDVHMVIDTIIFSHGTP